MTPGGKQQLRLFALIYGASILTLLVASTVLDLMLRLFR